MEERRQKPASPRHPPWLKVRAPFGEGVHNLKGLLADLKLHTVCEEAHCPNMGECWDHGVATFMILGKICTRGCRYCAVSKGVPRALDRQEPRRVAEAVRVMGLRHAVITSVDRDDLEDGGSAIFAETVSEIRRLHPECVVEVLIPDFKGSERALRVLLDSHPDILNHNIETVPRLYPSARGGGNYALSLNVLERAHQISADIVTKTGMMLGLGEKEGEIRSVMEDLVARRVGILTLGQYLRPSSWHLPVDRFYHPDEFEYWKQVGQDLGFEHVESGPLVRSSYLADKQFASFRDKKSP